MFSNSLTISSSCVSQNLLRLLSVNLFLVSSQLTLIANSSTNSSSVDATFSGLAVLFFLVDLVPVALEVSAAVSFASDRLIAA